MHLCLIFLRLCDQLKSSLKYHMINQYRMKSLVNKCMFLVLSHTSLTPPISHWVALNVIQCSYDCSDTIQGSLFIFKLNSPFLADNSLKNKLSLLYSLNSIEIFIALNFKTYLPKSILYVLIFNFLEISLMIPTLTCQSIEAQSTKSEFLQRGKILHGA